MLDGHPRKTINIHNQYIDITTGLDRNIFGMLEPN